MYPLPLHLESKNLENSVQQLHPTFLHWPPLEGPVYSVLPSSHSEAKCNLLFISSVTSISGPWLLLLICSQIHLMGLHCLVSILNFLPADYHDQRCCFPLLFTHMVCQPVVWCHFQCQSIYAGAEPLTGHPASVISSLPGLKPDDTISWMQQEKNIESLFNLHSFSCIFHTVVFLWASL